MGREALAKLFAVVGAFLCLYSLSAWVLLQGGTALSSVPGLEPRSPAQSAYFAIVIVGTTLFVTALIAIGHVMEPCGSNGWVFPIVGLGEAKIVDPSAWSTRLYVGFLASTILFVPAAALVHLNGKLLGDAWVWNEELPAAAVAPIACAMPELWPFGQCKVDQMKFYRKMEGVEAPSNGTARGELGRLWLASNACDIAWAREMAAPQVEERTKKTKNLTMSVEEKIASARLNLLDEKLRKELSAPVYVALAEPEYCAAPRLRSDYCRADESKCRGVEWSRTISPALIIVSSLLGWSGAFAFALIWMVREHRNGKKKRHLLLTS